MQRNALDVHRPQLESSMQCNRRMLQSELKVVCRMHRKLPSQNYFMVKKANHRRKNVWSKSKLIVVKNPDKRIRIKIES